MSIDYSKFGVSEKLFSDIINTLSFCKNITRAVIFGSRARGDYKYNSDIDICVYGDNLYEKEISILELNLNELDTPLSFDVVNFTKLSNQELISNIMKQGVEIYVRRKA